MRLIKFQAFHLFYRAKVSFCCSRWADWVLSLTVCSMHMLVWHAGPASRAPLVRMFAPHAGPGHLCRCSPPWPVFCAVWSAHQGSIVGTLTSKCSLPRLTAGELPNIQRAVKRLDSIRRVLWTLKSNSTTEESIWNKNYLQSKTVFLEKLLKPSVSMVTVERKGIKLYGGGEIWT